MSPKSRYWLNSPLRKTPEFAEEAVAICDLYQQAEALHQNGIHLISQDEKTGRQARERRYPTKPAEPSTPMRCEYGKRSGGRYQQSAIEGLKYTF